MLRLIEYNYPLLFSSSEFIYDCVSVVFCSVFTCVCGSYFWLHFLKREQKQTFPWYCLLTKTKLSFLYVFIFIWEICKSQWLISSSPQFRCLPLGGHNPVEQFCVFLSFAMKRLLSEREFFFLFLSTHCETKVTNNFF